MNLPYHPWASFRAYSKESADATALTVTLTPASGQVVMISQVEVTFDDAPTLTNGLAIEIKSGTTTLWKKYLLQGTNGDELGWAREWPEGLTGGVEDEAMTITVAAAGAGIKSRVNVLHDITTTGS